ncbi:MAG: hypothetical protein R3A79_12835 [Nannocystaceae bacterium]
MAMAAPDAPVASETLVTSDSPPPPAQSQQQGPASQTLTPNEPSQQTMRFDPGTAPTYHGPGITMQPQIQVQVQPQIQVTAQPHAEANPNTNSNSSSNAKSDIRNTATADADTKSDSQSQSQSSADSDIKTKQASSAAPAPAAPTAIVAKQSPTRIRVKTTVIPGQPKRVHPIYPYTPPKRRKGLMIAGWTIFGSSYLPTAFTGAQIYDWCSSNKTGSDRKECRELGQLLMIPVAGPFMAINEVDNATEGYFLALTGAVQTAGFLMGVIGTGQYIRDGKRNQRINAQGVRVAKGLRIGAGSLNYRF